MVGWVYRVPTEGDRLLYLGRLDTYLPSRVYMHTHRRTPVGMGLLCLATSSLPPVNSPTLQALRAAGDMWSSGDAC